MLKKILLSLSMMVLVLVPTLAGAYHYYSDAGYERVVYQTREVAEYVPYRKYVCDDSYAPRYDDYGYYGHGYTSHRNCYYVTDYRLETRTVQVPVREYVPVAAPVEHRTVHSQTHTTTTTQVRYEYPTVRSYNYNHSYRPVNTVSYYGYYYGI